MALSQVDHSICHAVNPYFYEAHIEKRVELMNISIDTAVFCEDGYCGHTCYLVLNPTTWQLTHLVIKPDNPAASYTQLMRLTPLPLVTRVQPQSIRLQCTLDTFIQCDSFIEAHYIETDNSTDEITEMPGWISSPSEEQVVVSVERKHILPGEIAVSRETQVEATNGHVGRFDQLVINREDGLITHVCFRRGHLWEQGIVTVPTTDIIRIQENAIYLKLDKFSVTRLPFIPVRA